MTQPNESAATDQDPLKNIVFITVPPHLEQDLGPFHIDSSVPLPVETVPGWTPDSLSWEQILAAMLKILAHQPSHEHAAYYRTFVPAVKPTIIDELSETAILKARNRDFALAHEIFCALRGLLPDDSRVTLNLALLAEQRAQDAAGRGDEASSARYTDEAFTLYRDLMADDDVRPDVYLNAGYFFLSQHNYDRAHAAFAAFLDTDSTDEEKRTEAQQIIDQIDSRNLVDTLFKEAYDFIRLGKEEQGIERITAFLAKQPQVWNGWFILGWAHRRLERYREAKEAFLKAIECGSTEVDTLNELAICRMELGEYDECRADLEFALTRDPEDVKIISNLGVLALRRGDPSEAAAFFRTALEIQPDDPVALHYLQSLES
ncbi:MAG: tetratricopeptide repeat protein [Spirochaetaceae bacterium]|nr:MAG: tetratricopeptide repeat protein [Spirochaetaceae bacterium]